jgi:hypothetical protein
LAVRFSAARQEHIHVHRIPPRVRDDRDTPLQWDETGADMPVIWVDAKREYFSLWDSTAQITPNLARRARVFFSRRMVGAKRYPSTKFSKMMGFAKSSASSLRTLG